MLVSFTLSALQRIMKAKCGFSVHMNSKGLTSFNKTNKKLNITTLLWLHRILCITYCVSHTWQSVILWIQVQSHTLIIFACSLAQL